MLTKHASKYGTETVPRIPQSTDGIASYFRSKLIYFIRLFSKNWFISRNLFYDLFYRNLFKGPAVYKDGR